MFEHINELALLVAALLAVAVGSIWYSPLVCGKTWMQAIEKQDLDVDFLDRGLLWLTVRAILLVVVLLSLVTWLSVESGISYSPMVIAGVMWGIILAHLALVALWERRPLAYIGVHGGYIGLVLFGGLSVIMYWPW